MSVLRRAPGRGPPSQTTGLIANDYRLALTKRLASPRLASRDEILMALVAFVRFRFGEKYSPRVSLIFVRSLTFRFCCRFNVARRKLHVTNGERSFDLLNKRC